MHEALSHGRRAFARYCCRCWSAIIVTYAQWFFRRWVRQQSVRLHNETRERRYQRVDRGDDPTRRAISREEDLRLQGARHRGRRDERYARDWNGGILWREYYCAN